MKITQVPYCFYPDPVGGTEIYVEALAKNLQEQGFEVVVVAPGERNEVYRHEGFAVRRFAVGPVTDLRDLYEEGDGMAAETFARILDEEQPDLVHLHAFTRGVSLRLVREAKRRNIPVIFTYHTPTVSCQRGTLMRWGKEACDGVLRLHTCSRCTLHGLGAGKGQSYFLGTLPTAVGRLVGALGLSGGIWTALRMTELVKLKHESFRALVSEVDHVVATAEWVKELLIRNQVPPEKITISRQGIDPNGFDSSTPRSKNRDSQSGLRVAFVGRMHPTKGLDVLVQALRSAPDLNLSLEIYGMVQGIEGQLYERRLRALARGDERINFCGSVAREEVIPLFGKFDLLAVPSQIVETGPMVILEAFAAGVPVVGSHLGGIAELVQDGSNGLLVEPPSSLERWRWQLERILEDKDLLARLRRGIRPPRQMQEVANEMKTLYEAILERNRDESKNPLHPIH